MDYHPSGRSGADYSENRLSSLSKPCIVLSVDLTLYVIRFVLVQISDFVTSISLFLRKRYIQLLSRVVQTG
jgi:hypothetical protein